MPHFARAWNVMFCISSKNLLEGGSVMDKKGHLDTCMDYCTKHYVRLIKLWISKLNPLLYTRESYI